MDMQFLWDGIDKLVDKVDENKDKIVKAAAVIFVAGKSAEKISRNYSRSKRAKEDRYHREQEIYDRTTGMYIQLRRPMTSQEQYEYSVRLRKGEQPIYILRDLGLLKENRGRQRRKGDDYRRTWR